MTNQEEEPVSPMARVFQSPRIDLCAVTIVGFETKINPDVVLDALKQNVSKHPRFSSILSENGAKWIETEVNVEDHVIVPYIDPEEIGGDGQSFVDDYMSRLTMIPLDRSRPLWDIHILNVKTYDAEAVDMVLLLATVLYLKDTKTPLKADVNTRNNPKRFYHRIISLDDIKHIKNAMDMTINDVLFGMSQASFSRYLNRRYDKRNEENGALTSYPNNLPEGIRFRVACTVNLRSDIGFKALLVHLMSYADKMIISMAFDPTVIPDPHMICDDMEESLKEMKAALHERGLL
ncbi:PREDICTED: O-acyltransferase WSD1-like [Camelina sativa]|uniref:O-acyltransferase WSD1-like n=1 Tax=Camelina sativa TaxID=90675 RepID=A0ABM1QBP3_CAMSA|nr:PREDICTED: O-acyltransferase WSD1-like [Camelina sativa]